ncbi:DUF3218 family protein [Pseudomonas aeruginosa]|uniref:DUF3218 family protein n=1 Tax=Pseudomonas aeruginosa TaxID=287 RepID=UPI00222F39FF|nr:DUF3218 family protein [Pseudomonas aeruginosa]HBO0799790.1 DUF3218 family protein [Pseudomonas aeruginosa]HBO1471924.1 DUF3218 family protein [Pseudomonas aeruginosa]HBO7099528.1 DUF3218 domain-containing protein [Pseudomonas aeruginosa]HBP5204597.1 DUF3218 domain-containing protein [Pseudomonas aeruginosa]HCF5279434.1 DUF3218 family protein [Pseudomonas aeruginosa]
MTDAISAAQDQNIYVAPGASLTTLYKGLHNICTPGAVFPEAETAEAWDIPLRLHPEFVPDGDINAVNQQYVAALAQETSNILLLGFQMSQNKDAVCGDLTPLIQSTRANLVSVKSKYGTGLLGVLGQSINLLPNSIAITPGSGGGATDSSGLLVGYGVNLGTLTTAQLSAMNLPQSIKTLITPGVGLHLGAVNFSTVFNQIRDGMRYVTGMALTLAYHAL